MRLGIFHKIIAIFLVVIFITFSFISGILYFFLNEHFINENIGQAEEVVKQASIAFQEYVISYRKFYKQGTPIALEMIKFISLSFNANIRYLSDMTDSHIWIVSEKGQIGHAYPELPATVKRSYMDNEGLIQLPVPDQYLILINNKENTFIDLGDFFGFFSQEAYKYTGDTWLTYGEKFYLNDTQNTGNDENIYLVYVHMPASQIKQTQQKIIKYLWISIVISLTLSMVLIYIMTKRLTNPIKEMNKMSKVISSGQFSGRLEISTKDEIGELAQSFNQMIVSLEKIEEMRARFVSNVSHELRTPMTTIKGFVEGILDGTIPFEKQSLYLNIVKDEVDRLSKLITDLLTLSRFEAAGHKIEFEDFDIQESIRRCIINLEGLIDRKNLDLNIHFCEEFLYVYANKDSIERVIYNLLHNAIKFSHPNGIISVTTSINKDLAGVTVEDYGIGMKKEELEKIWDRFYTVDESRGMDNTGTGLGLSIIKNVMENHNQPISVESEPGRGTKFHFTLLLSNKNNK